MTRNHTLVLVTAGIAVAAFAVGALLYQASRKPPAASAPAASGSPGATTTPPALADPSVLVRFNSPVIGPSNAPVTIVEFLDPACEACRAFYPYVKQLLAAYPTQVRVVVRYVPFHGEASVEGVRILEAARVQGKFDAVIQALFESQDAWASHGKPTPGRAWEGLEKTGLDVKRAREHAATGAADLMLVQETEDYKAAGVRGTPTFFVNGRYLAESHPDALKALVQGEVARVARP